MKTPEINLIEELLVNPSFEQSNNLRHYIKLSKRDTVERPIIYIGSGTCGRAAGATDTIEAIKKYLEENQFDADIVETGCIGLCSAEPIVDIQLPGMNRISYKNVTTSEIPFYKYQKRNVLSLCGKIDPVNLDEYIANGGFKAFAHSIT